MHRYNKIQKVFLNDNELKLPISFSISKSSKFSTVTADNAFYAKSIDCIQKMTFVEITTRDILAAENLELGNVRNIEIIVSDSENKTQTLAFSASMLIEAKTEFSQKDFSFTKLKFICKSSDGFANPMELIEND